MLLILIIVLSAMLVLLGGYLMPVLVAIALAYLLEAVTLKNTHRLDYLQPVRSC